MTNRQIWARVGIGILPIAVLAVLTRYWWPLVLVAAFWALLGWYTMRKRDASR